jgi:hypothetical protein
MEVAMPKPNNLSDLEKEALLAEIDRNRAEKAKLSLESSEIEKRLESNIFGFSWSSVLKAAIGGIVAGILVWSFALEHLLKLNNTNEIRLKDIEKEQKKLVSDNEKLRIAYEDLRIEYVNTQKELATVKKESDVKETKIIDRTLSALESQTYQLDEKISTLAALKSSDTFRKSEGTVKAGWIYLGEYSDGTWKTKNFNFSNNIKPEQLKGKKISPTVLSVNIRKEPYFGDIVGNLPEDFRVHVLDLYAFGTGMTGYIWARI